MGKKKYITEEINIKNCVFWCNMRVSHKLQALQTRGNAATDHGKHCKVVNDYFQLGVIICDILLHHSFPFLSLKY